MQDEKKFLKIKFEEQKIVSNFCKSEEVHVLFYSEKNNLLSHVLSDDKNLASFLKINITINHSNFIIR